ncbi:MAG TPA: ABC transporter permease [Candidatus Binatia bacterium]|nr:ABC transporter permease [Candidatus Binatia bacterium]
MKIHDLVHDAVRGVRLHRVRSGLTAAGFAAGAAAAVALLAITGGARAEILRRLAALGMELVAVRPVGEAAPGAPPALTFGDAEALSRALRFVRAVAPVRAVESSVLLPTERVSVRAIGTTSEFFTLRRLRFQRGRAFRDDEVTRGDTVCVLGSEAARRFAASGEAYGALVKVGGNWYRVIGVLARESRDGAEWAGGGTNPGREVYLPITNTFAPDAFRRQGLAEAWLAIDSDVDPEAAAPIVERVLENRHEGKQRFEVTTAARLLSEHRATRGLLNRLLFLVSLAAFVLAAVGMTTASWQNVRNRTREIAIRRAVGARQSEVLAQFVLEGVVVAAAGAAAGIAAGVAGSGVASWMSDWPWMLSPLEAASTFALAIALAIVSTLYPAAYAAALDPVVALRFDR